MEAARGGWWRVGDAPEVKRREIHVCTTLLLHALSLDDWKYEETGLFVFLVAYTRAAVPGGVPVTDRMTQTAQSVRPTARISRLID